MQPNLQLVRTVIESMAENNDFRGLVIDNPALAFVNAGMAIDDSIQPQFNAFFHKTMTPRFADAQVHQQSVDLLGVECTLCQIGAYTIAIGLVGIGAAGLALLTATSPVVVALAAFAGVSAAIALAFIVGLTTVVVAGVEAVLMHICGWVRACS